MSGSRRRAGRPTREFGCDLSQREILVRKMEMEALAPMNVT